MAVHATTGAQSKAQVQLAFSRRISDILVFEPMFAAIQDASKAHGAVTEAGREGLGEPEQNRHVVLPGETFWSIAAQHGGAQELLALNPQIKNPNLLAAGDVVRIK